MRTAVGNIKANKGDVAEGGGRREFPKRAPTTRDAAVKEPQPNPRNAENSVSSLARELIVFKATCVRIVKGADMKPVAPH